MDAFAAVKAGDMTLLKQVLAASPDKASSRDDAGVSLLMTARYRMRLDMVEEILSHHGALDVFEAASLGKMERVRMILARDAGAIDAHSADGFTPLHLAAFFGQPAVMELLLDRGARVDAISSNAMKLRALHSAAAADNLDAVTLLLARGAEVNAHQHGGFTALMAAASNGNLAMVSVLLDKGADASLTTDDGTRAVDLARAKGHTEVVTRLLASPGTSP
jgi:ankyrin repeat protein